MVQNSPQERLPKHISMHSSFVANFHIKSLGILVEEMGRTCLHSFYHLHLKLYTIGFQSSAKRSLGVLVPLGRMAWYFLGKFRINIHH